MFFRKIILFLSVISLTVPVSGCSKINNDSSEDKYLEITTEEELLATAFELFNAEDVRGTTTVYTTTYEDGTTSSETEHIIYDISKGIIHKSYITEDGVNPETIYVQDGTDVYCYEKDSSAADGWIRYLENPDENGETSFDYTLAEFSYSFNKASGYTDVSISNEGTEVLNGVNTTKLFITATSSPSSEDDSDESRVENDSSVTRKDIIKEFGWSEESVQAVDGFSEILDQYVAYQNKDEVKAINNEEPVENYIVWIDKESSRILQLQSSFSIESTSPEISSDIEDKFWDNCWKVDWIQSDIDDGLTIEQAKEILELEGAYMEEQLEYEDSLDIPDESVSESGSFAQKVTYVKTFLIGEDCPPLPEIPSGYTETTYEDYYTAFEE